MMEGNPYKVVVRKYRRRFKTDAVGNEPIETINRKTGEVRVATQLIGTQKIYDTTDFVKLFEPRILIGLSVGAVYVLSYIMSCLRFGGYVLFNYKDCMLYTGYQSRQTIYRGLLELTKKDIIRPKKRCEWWVNPNFIYRGQRDEFDVSQ